MKKTIFWLVCLALLLVACAPATPVTTVKVSYTYPRQDYPTVVLGGKYTEMSTGDGFTLESVDGIGAYFGDYDLKMTGYAEGPYRKIVFRSIVPGVQFTQEAVAIEITHLREEYFKLRDVTLYYKDHEDKIASATEPVLTETGIEFWTGRNDNPACEYVPSQDVPTNEYEGDRIAWHCVLNFSQSADGLIAYLYLDGRPE